MNPHNDNFNQNRWVVDMGLLVFAALILGIVAAIVIYYAPEPIERQYEHFYPLYGDHQS